MIESLHEAPRFRLYLERLARRPLAVMQRSEWDRLKLRGSGVVAIDLHTTPLANLALETYFEVAIAERKPDGRAIISIYRRDPKDDPTPINKDVYQVWEFLPARFNVPSFIVQASTEDNANLRGFLGEHVFLVKERPGADHWMDDLPAVVWAVVDEVPDNPV